MAWSPDQELVVFMTGVKYSVLLQIINCIILYFFVFYLFCMRKLTAHLSPYMAFISSFTGEETLIMMTKDFDPISEFPCHSEEFGEGTWTSVFPHIQIYFIYLC